MTTLDTDRKRAIRKHADLATERDRWIERNSNTTQFLVPRGPDGARLGCGTGRLLAALKASRGVDRLQPGHVGGGPPASPVPRSPRRATSRIPTCSTGSVVRSTRSCSPTPSCPSKTRKPLFATCRGAADSDTRMIRSYFAAVLAGSRTDRADRPAHAPARARLTCRRGRAGGGRRHHLRVAPCPQLAEHGSPDQSRSARDGMASVVDAPV
jgi:hypothetical protein